MKTNALTTLLLAALIALPSATLAACGDDESDSGGSAATSGDGGSGKDSDKKSEDDAPDRDAKVVGSKTAKGEFPAVLASATIEDPGTIKVRATPSPAKSTAVSWTVACRKGRKAGTKDGRFTVRAAETKTLRKPMARSDSCNVSVSAQMSGSGTIKLEIIA
ncbi:MAG TPA: hypothetical protein VMY78_18655 [Solirubrobacteraceae bacterium]|nr:hypothetical protein [Solirubrobacteraceae bacterium]